MAAAFFGLIVAVILRFLFGGMSIGLKCLDLIVSIHKVQKLAQFGIIFLYLIKDCSIHSRSIRAHQSWGSTVVTGRLEKLLDIFEVIGHQRITKSCIHERVAT